MGVQARETFLSVDRMSNKSPTEVAAKGDAI